MNWGIRITILYMSFVTLILTLVFITSNNKEELESIDYYKQELDYQTKIDALNNANSLKHPIDYEIISKSISLVIPSELNSMDFIGEIYLFKPSDASKDVRLEFKYINNGKMLLSDPQIQKGVYKMKITIVSNKKKYIKEEVINIS